MRKLINLSLVFILVLSLLAGCTGKEQENKETNSTGTSDKEAKYEDGIYFAQQDGFDPDSGWKSVVTLEVKDGKITSADWNAANKNGGKDKKTASKEGNYPMVEKGGAKAPWHEQAKKAEDYLIEKQDPTAIEYKDDEGHTDAISGVSVHVNDFFTLAETALEKGPVGEGEFQDGAYHAEEPEFDDKGWKYTVDLTVINGRIVAVNWNAVQKDSEEDKKTASNEGNYPMVEKGGAKAPWHEQAKKAEEYLLEKQDPTAIEYKDDEGHTDAISGVSIQVSPLFKLAEKALTKGN